MIIELRPMINFIRERHKANELSGAEIGVHKGYHAMVIVTHLNIKKLYLVDPYLAYKDYKEPNWINKKQSDYDSYLKEAKENLEPYGSKIEFIRKKSSEAIIPDNLDFVYIDGNHDYKYVKEDIEKYYNKIRAGGYLGGDNYELHYGGVVKAVDEFCKSKNLILYTGLSKVSRDWWIIKEGKYGS